MVIQTVSLTAFITRQTPTNSIMSFPKNRECGHISSFSSHFRENDDLFGISLAYNLLEAILCLALQGAELVHIYVRTLHLKLIKIGANNLYNTRRIHLSRCSKVAYAQVSRYQINSLTMPHFFFLLVPHQLSEIE